MKRLQDYKRHTLCNIECSLKSLVTYLEGSKFLPFLASARIEISHRIRGMCNAFYVRTVRKLDLPGEDLCQLRVSEAEQAEAKTPGSWRCDRYHELGTVLSCVCMHDAWRQRRGAFLIRLQKNIFRSPGAFVSVIPLGINMALSVYDQIARASGTHQIPGDSDLFLIISRYENVGLISCFLQELALLR